MGSYGGNDAAGRYDLIITLCTYRTIAKNEVEL